MSVTIMEVLENAQFNLKSGNVLQFRVGLSQLDNAIALLEKGYEAEDEFIDPAEAPEKGKE